MLEDSDKGPGRFGRRKGKNPTGKKKQKQKQEHMVPSNQDMRLRRRSKVSASIARQQVINERTAGKSRSSSSTNRTKHSSWKGKDGKIQSSKGEGKKGKSKDAGALAWTEQLMCDQASGTPVASTTASSAQQTETSTTVGTVECAGLALDLCGTTTARQGNANGIASRWRAANLDIGSGGTVWLMNADFAFEKVAGPEGRNFKTAAGDIVEGQGRFRVGCHGVWEAQFAHDWKKRRQFATRC